MQRPYARRARRNNKIKIKDNNDLSGDSYIIIHKKRKYNYNDKNKYF